MHTNTYIYLYTYTYTYDKPAMYMYPCVYSARAIDKNVRTSVMCHSAMPAVSK